MGLQWRKRTKGASSWLNFSASKARGLGSSLSIKFGNITGNIGSGGRRRVTINFGNGFHYVKTRTVKKTKPEPKKQFNSAEFASRLEAAADRLENSKGNCENWTSKEWTVFVVVVTIVCFIIQIAMR